MITVACVLRSGGRYDAEWVRKLRDGVRRHLTLPYRFVCLSDVDVPCERIPLEYDWPLLSKQRGGAHNWAVAPAWWSKLELFRGGLFSGTVLYLDLDSLIVGPLDELVQYPHKFTMADDPWRQTIGGPLCSAVMAWTGHQSFLFDAFLADPDGYAHRYDVIEPNSGRIGDQAYIEDMFKRFNEPIATFRQLFGPVLASYKGDKLQDGPPDRASIVQFHGLPKMNEFTSGWVAEAWK